MNLNDQNENLLMNNYKYGCGGEYYSYDCEEKVYTSYVGRLFSYLHLNVLLDFSYVSVLLRALYLDKLVSYLFIDKVVYYLFNYVTMMSNLVYNVFVNDSMVVLYYNLSLLLMHASLLYMFYCVYNNFMPYVSTYLKDVFRNVNEYFKSDSNSNKITKLRTEFNNMKQGVVTMQENIKELREDLNCKFKYITKSLKTLEKENDANETYAPVDFKF
jgi:hypothetical protein